MSISSIAASMIAPLARPPTGFRSQRIGLYAVM